MDHSKSLHEKLLFNHFHPFKTGCLRSQVGVWSPVIKSYQLELLSFSKCLPLQNVEGVEFWMVFFANAPSRCVGMHIFWEECWNKLQQTLSRILESKILIQVAHDIKKNRRTARGILHTWVCLKMRGVGREVCLGVCFAGLFRGTFRGVFRTSLLK